MAFKDVQKLQVLSYARDGTPLPHGSVRIYIDTIIYDAALESVVVLLEDPANSFTYIASEMWKDPTKLVSTLISMYYKVRP